MSELVKFCMWVLVYQCLDGLGLRYLAGELYKATDVVQRGGFRLYNSTALFVVCSANEAINAVSTLCVLNELPQTVPSTMEHFSTCLCNVPLQLHVWPSVTLVIYWYNNNNDNHHHHHNCVQHVLEIRK